MQEQSRQSQDGQSLHRKRKGKSQITVTTMIREDREVVLHIIVPLMELIKKAPQTTTIKIGETATGETELLLTGTSIQEVLEMTTPGAIAIRIILVLSTKDHRKLI